MKFLSVISCCLVLAACMRPERTLESVNAACATEWNHAAAWKDEVRIGMSEACVRQAWGGPGSINKTITSRGTEEQWVYHNSYRYNFLYMENGLLVSIQSGEY